MLLCDLTCGDMLPAEQVKRTQMAIQRNGMEIVPQLLCPLIVPGTPGQDEVLIEMATEYYTADWAAVNGCTKAEIPVLCRVATFLSDLIAHLTSTKPCSCCGGHRWPILEDVACKAGVTL